MTEQSNYINQSHLRAFRQPVVNQFHGCGQATAIKSGPSFARTIEIGRQMVAKGSDPIAALRDFHQRELIRIAGYFKVSGEVLETSRQLSDLRQALVITLFHLATRERQGDLALAIGGSVVRGDHTGLTDAEVIILPASEADRPAAQRVQALMARNMRAIFLEPDEAMAYHFDANPLEMLAIHLTPATRKEITDPFLASMRLSNGFVLSFLMDLQIIGYSGKIAADVYRRNLAALQERVLFSHQAAFFEMCQDMYETKSKETKEKTGPFDIKNEALKPFYNALYGIRVKLHLTDPSPWNTLKVMAERGLISGAEKDTCAEALRFFIALRHLISFSVFKAEDSAALTETALLPILQYCKTSKGGLQKQLEIHTRSLREISERILDQAGGGNVALPINAKHGPGNAPGVQAAPQPYSQGIGKLR